jgi:hypothetical protein
MRRVCYLVLSALLPALAAPTALAGSAVATPHPPAHHDDGPQAP